MEITLRREYHSQGLNGKIFHGGLMICESIELPWRQNQVGISCIPEGEYVVLPRSSPKYGAHFSLQDVPGRSMILIHPANFALTELRGCIAPVTRVTGPGTGIFSKKAMQKFSALVNNQVNVFLIIRS